MPSRSLISAGTGPPSAGVVRSLLLTLLPVAYLVKCFIEWRRLAHVPGPFWWSVSPLPMLRANLGGYSHKSLSDLSREYGPLVRIGPNAVLTTDFRHCQKMEAPKSAYRKGPWYGTFRFQKDVDHSFSLMDEDKHAALKTKIGPGYSANVMVEEAIDRQLARLFSLLDRKHVNDRGPRHGRSKTTKRADLSVLTQFLALDIVGDMTFGKPFGFLDEGEDIYDWIKWNEGFFPIASTCATFPVLGRLFQTWPFSEALPKSTDTTGLGCFIRAAEETLDERFEPDAKPKRDMIDKFLRQGATKSEATSEALVQVVAGTDSVAVALRMALVYILTNPRVYNKLMAEIDAAYAKTNATPTISMPPSPAASADSDDESDSESESESDDDDSDSDSDDDSDADSEASTPASNSDIIRNAAAKNMPYLQAVIREAVRVFPSQTPLLNKTVPEGGDTVAGYTLPAGTQVGMDGWGILRSKQHWGDDADVFRPERWIEAASPEADPGQLEDMSSCLEALFGYGRFRCMGRSVAFMQMSKALPELLRRYDFTIIEPTRPVEKMHSAAFWMMAGLWVTIEPRESAD